MKNIFALIFIIISSSIVKAQCDDFGEKIFDILQLQEYDKFDNHLLSEEQIAEVLHWPKKEVKSELLTSMRDSLKVLLNNSAKDFRISRTNKSMDFQLAKFVGCIESGNSRLPNLKIQFLLGDHLDSLTVETIKYKGKRYIMMPINHVSGLMESFDKIEKKIEGSHERATATIIDGVRYENFTISEEELTRGETILRLCLDDSPKKEYLIIGSEGLIDSNNGGSKYIYFRLLDKKQKNLTIYWVNLTSKICRKDD